MTSDIIKDARKARLILEQGKYSFVICRNGEILFRSSKKWLTPFFDALDEDPRIFDGAVVGDRVVGRAAAYLCAHMKPAAVMGLLVTYDAISILEKTSCTPFWKETIPCLTNMDSFTEDELESLLENASNNDDALEIIKNATPALQTGQSDA